jgi:hypothetical protein
MRTVSIEQFIQAVEVNGYPLAKRYFFKTDHINAVNLHLKSTADLEELPEGDIVDACAFGQAAFNLGVAPHDLWDAMEDSLALHIIPIQVITMNDEMSRTPKQIARALRKEWKDALTETFDVPEFDLGRIFTNYQGKKV